MEGRYNTRSPAVKRLMKEAQELSEPTDQYFAQPLEDNLFEWHFTVRGPADSDFQNGIYHGRIILPVDYPMKPPSIIWLTPNGRFETNKKICLSISGHHPESWQPSWSIRTALLAIIGFMPTHPGGAIGSLDYKPEERKVLAKKSRDWKCPSCGDISSILLEASAESSQTSKEAKELASQIAFQGEKPKCKEAECPIEAAATSAAATTSASNPPTSTSATVSNNAAPASPPVAGGMHVPSPPLQPFYSPFTPWGYPPPGSFSPVPPVVNPQTSPGTQESGIAAAIPRFPYPPSHYPGGYSVPFYPPGFSPPLGMGSFPCPLPSRTHTSSSAGPVPVSNSTVSSQAPTAGPTTTTYTRSPMSTPVSNRSPSSPAPTEQAVPTTGPSDVPPPSPARTKMLNELRDKVKRVGSDDAAPPQPSAEGPSTPPEVQNDKDSIQELLHVADEKTETIGDGSAMEDNESKKQDTMTGVTDSELSKSLKRKESHNERSGTEYSHSELLADGEENSEAGIPPLEIDTEQRSNFERNISSSTSELDRKLRQGNAKTLRQRQSATARVPAEITEDEQTSTDQASAVGARQRIEAASGDTTGPNQQRLHRRAVRLVHEVHHVQGGGLFRVGNEQSPYDTSFIVMVALFLGTVFILLNRVISMIDWSDFPSDLFMD